MIVVLVEFDGRESELWSFDRNTYRELCDVEDWILTMGAPDVSDIKELLCV